MRIAFFTDVYLPAVDGVVNSILDAKRELERRGHKVYIFTVGKKSLASKDVFIYRGVKFRPYPQYSLTLFPLNSVFKVKKLEIDIIHAQTPFFMGFAGLVISRLYKLPILSTYHTFVDNKDVVKAYYPKNRVLSRITKRSLKRYLRFFYSRCDTVVAPSNAIKEHLATKYNLKSIKVVPNGIDMQRFHPSEKRKANGIKTILYLGRLSKEKKLEILMEAYKLLSNEMKVRLVIGGDGPARRHYESLARKLGIRAEFLGFVKPKDLSKLYSSADVLCLPSNFETQGIVALEAMASGIPVVASDYLGLKELVDGRNGEKFMPNNVNSCKAKLKKVLKNPGRYKKHALETANEYSIERTVGRLITAYEEVMGAI